MKNVLRSLAATLAATLATLAATTTLAAPVSYTLDPDHLVPRFEILHNGFSLHTGAFMKSTGKAMLDVEAKTGSVEVTTQTASFLAGHAFMESVIKGKDFFNVEQFPAMTFKSTKINFQGDKPATVDGELTLLGVTKPVSFNVTYFNCGQHPRTKKDQCGGNFAATIKRSDFGMKAFIPAVADDVKLNIQVEAFKD